LGGEGKIRNRPHWGGKLKETLVCLESPEKFRALKKKRETSEGEKGERWIRRESSRSTEKRNLFKISRKKKKVTGKDKEKGKKRPKCEQGGKVCLPAERRFENPNVTACARGSCLLIVPEKRHGNSVGKGGGQGKKKMFALSETGARGKRLLRSMGKGGGDIATQVRKKLSEGGRTRTCLRQENRGPLSKGRLPSSKKTTFSSWTGGVSKGGIKEDTGCKFSSTGVGKKKKNSYAN